jgi:hypothetical protein
MFVDTMANNAIEPADSPDGETKADSDGSGVFHKGSGVFNSMASLTPSNLDQAIMEMLNIKPQAGIRGVCDGKRIWIYFFFFCLTTYNK